MLNNQYKITIYLITIISSSYYLVSCKNAPIKTDYGDYCLIDCISKDEFKRRQQDPSLMIQEIEEDRRSETLKDKYKQNAKEEADRNKRLNELLDKQLHGQSE